jgi:hypothetical protein
MLSDDRRVSRFGVVSRRLVFLLDVPHLVLKPREQLWGFLLLSVYRRTEPGGSHSVLCYDCVGHDAPGKLRYGRSRPPVRVPGGRGACSDGRRFN